VSKKATTESKYGKFNIVIYIGDDDNYWENIKNRYRKTYSEEYNFKFKKLWSKNSNKYYANFLKIIEIQPAIIYIDFSIDLKVQLDLAKVLQTDNLAKKITTVGLVDSREELRECSDMTHFSHIKCGELHDVIYDPVHRSFPKRVRTPDFALAHFTRDVDLFYDVRIAYINEKSIHAEGNIKLREGDIITLRTEFDNAMIPSDRFVVKKVTDSNLFFNYRYAYDLDFVFVDRPNFDDLDEEYVGVEHTVDEDGEVVPGKRRDPKLVAAIKKDRLDEYETNLQLLKKRFKKWVDDHLDLSAKQKSKILVIDHESTVFKKEVGSLSRYPYLIRCQRELSENLEEISRFRPDIIAFQFNNPFSMEMDDESDDFDEYDDDYDNEEDEESIEQLKAILKKIKGIKDYKPFLILFNNMKYSSKAIQDSFKYPLVLSHAEAMKMGVVMDMALLYEQKREKKRQETLKAKVALLKKKDPKRFRNLSIDDFKNRNYYLKGSNKLSHASYAYPIEITSMTESELTFQTDVQLQLDRFRMEFPTEMGVTLVEDEALQNKAKKGKIMYRGLMHSIGEEDKKAIRRFVNEIFFRYLNEQREREAQEYARITEEAKTVKKKESKDAVAAPTNFDDENSKEEKE
jgi:hypothetical protein